MRDILNLNPIEYQLNDYTIISFDSFPEYDREDYDLNIPKDMDRFIKAVKYDTRNSFEYKQFMQFLKQNLDMNKCSFLENIKGEHSRRVKIEIHHDPFTIEDIIRTVIRKRLCYLEIMEPEQVSKEVMFLHYKLMVGLIPLSTTVHELVGNNYLFIPTSKVMGNYKSFVECYSDFIEPETKAILDRIEEATLVYDDTRAHDLLKKHYIYINVGDSELPTYDTIIQMMKDRIDAINKNKAPIIMNQDNGLRKGFYKVDPEDVAKLDLL